MAREFEKELRQQIRLPREVNGNDINDKIRYMVNRDDGTIFSAPISEIKKAAFLTSGQSDAEADGGSR